MRTLVAALLFCSTAAAAQTMYRWTDKNGEVHYTDDRSTVPAGAKLETTEGEELMIEPPRPPAAIPQQPKPIRAAPLPPEKKRQSGPVEVHLAQVNVPVSEGDRTYIEDSLRTAAASPRLATWGGLRESVEVEIAPAQRMVGYGSDAFGMAVGNNKMLLRAPNDTRHGGRPLDYAGTALHELAHILEHQIAGQHRPRWFAEGFASVVAENDRAQSIDDVAYWVIHDGGKQPLDALFTNRVEHANPGCSRCCKRSEAFVLSNTTGSDQGWLFRLVRGSTFVASGKVFQQAEIGLRWLAIDGSFRTLLQARYSD